MLFPSYNSHPHHFQLNEVVPNHTLWYQNCQCQWIAQFWVLFFTWTLRPVGVLNFGNSSSPWSKAKRILRLFTVISTGNLCQSDGKEYSLYVRAWLTVFTLLPSSAAGQLWKICCISDVSQRLVVNVQRPKRPKCNTSGEWNPYPATQEAKASFTAILHVFVSHATNRTRRRTPWMSELSSRLLKALLSESFPYP